MTYLSQQTQFSVEFVVFLIIIDFNITKMETRKFKNGEKEIDVKVDTENKQIYLSQKDMTLLFEKSKDAIKRILRKLNSEFGATGTIFALVQIENGREVNRNIIHYNQDIILKVGYKCNIEIANRFKEWVDTLFKEDDTTNITNNWLSEANNYEIVKFESGEVSLDVNVSPNEDTVWLTQSDMSLLFGVTKQNISLHIINIFNDNELDKNSVVKESLTTAIDGKIYNLTYYNLDIVLSVGYRVKSTRAMEFRRWANSILKQYLIKGYAINNKM